MGIDPEVIEEYRKWLHESGAPTLRLSLPRYGGEVVGIWFNRPGASAPPPDGKEAKKHLRTTNVSWIIRWQNEEARTRGWEGMAVDPDFVKMLARREEAIGPKDFKRYIWAETKLCDDI